MSKAILILDEMPLYCDVCPIQADDGVCVAIKRWVSGRREYNDCPIKELPCKVGDTIYFVYYDSVPGTAYINEITVTEVSNCRIWGDDEVFDYDDIGRTIFLCLKDAEIKREEMECTAKPNICKCHLKDADVISRKEVLDMLHGLGGCGAKEDWYEGWDSAIDTAISKLGDIPARTYVEDDVDPLGYTE